MYNWKIFSATPGTCPFLAHELILNNNAGATIDTNYPYPYTCLHYECSAELCMVSLNKACTKAPARSKPVKDWRS